MDSKMLEGLLGATEGNPDKMAGVLSAVMLKLAGEQLAGMAVRGANHEQAADMAEALGNVINGKQSGVIIIAVASFVADMCSSLGMNGREQGGMKLPDSLAGKENLVILSALMDLIKDFTEINRKVDSGEIDPSKIDMDEVKAKAAEMREKFNREAGL